MPLELMQSLEVLADKLARRIADFGYDVTYCKFLILSQHPLPTNPQFYRRLQYAVAPAIGENIMILPVVLAQTIHIALEDCTPEIEAEYNEVVTFGTHKLLIRYTYNVIQEWRDNEGIISSRVSVKAPHLTVLQALDKLDANT